MPKTNKRYYEKENYRSVIPMNTDAEILSKILVNGYYQERVIHRDGSLSGIQG
jgi:hypothetical protein